MFAALSVLSLCYPPYRMFSDDTLVVAGSAVLLGISAFFFWATRSMKRTPDIGQATFRKWLLAVIVGGLTLRVMYIAAVQPVQLSDMESYWNAAIRLVEEGRYYYPTPLGDLVAWRPPGYPFLLYILVVVFGKAPWIPWLVNGICFAVTALSTSALARQLGLTNRSALIAAVILACWPGAIAGFGMAATEWLSLALFTAGLWAFLKSQCLETSLGVRIGSAILVGIVTGVGVLVRPSLLFVPLIWIMYSFSSRQSLSRSLIATTIAVGVTVVVIAPWTVRNAVVLDAFVPVSTNGGSVFYRANNPLASGGFATTGARDIDALKGNEVEWNRTGFEWGLQWIKENPADFLVLAAKKQAILLGSDDTWIYWSLFRAHGQSGFIYDLLRFIANTWWILILLALPIAAIRRRDFLMECRTGIVLLAMTMYPVAVHSVFESQPRHHYSIIGFLAILVVMACGASRRRVDMVQCQDRRQGYGID